MIQLSPRGKLEYQCLHLVVALLLVYALLLALSALSQLPQRALPVEIAADWQRLGERVFTLICLSSFISGGIAMAGESLGDAAVKRLLRLWLAAVALVLGMSPVVAGATLDLCLALALLAGLAWSAGKTAAAPGWRLWQLGMLLIALCLAAGHVVGAAAADAIAAVQLHLAFPLCALSLAGWLLDGADEDRESRLPVRAFWLVCGGGLISLSRLGMPALLAYGAAGLAGLAYIMLAAHLARALREPNPSKSLAGQWLGLAALCWLVSGGLGALSMPAGAWAVMRGTSLMAAQEWLGGCIALAIALALINERATALRGDNRRVTGYAPFWLFSFGAGLSFIVQLCQGVGQVVLREVAPAVTVSGIATLRVLGELWTVCQLAVAAGLLIYALGYLARRQRIRVVQP